MNPHEKAFVEAFIPPHRQERFMAALANPKKRDVFKRELNHPKPGFLIDKYIEQIVPSQQFTRFLAPKLRGMGAPDDCWVFGNYIDGRAMKLEEALGELNGMGTGTIVSCLPGELAYFESEDERVILHKPRGVTRRVP
ncbi:MAG: hypothetical protein ACLPWF_03315 [Bryobacteraceae bacterium]|jgi:hypothetical protein